MNRKELERRLIVAPIATDISEEEVRAEINETKGFEFRSIIVEQHYVPTAKAVLANEKVRLGMTVSYPLGAMTTETKVMLAEYACSQGLDEIDLSLDYNAIKSNDFAKAQADLQKVVDAVRGRLDIVAIPLVAKMTLAELNSICQMILQTGVSRIKTNSGMNLGNTELEHIEFIKRRFQDRIVIEASGGIRAKEQAERYIRAGADCIHTSTWRQVLGLEGVKTH
jgi:deoxyribose-phosphate aldolase